MLEAALAALKMHGFPTVEIEKTIALITLAVREDGMDAKLRVQVHQTFASLVSREPVLWMLTVYSGNRLVASDAGRLQGAGNGEILNAIGGEFVTACLEARGGEGKPYDEESRRQRGKAYLALRRKLMAMLKKSSGEDLRPVVLLEPLARSFDRFLFSRQRIPELEPGPGEDGGRSVLLRVPADAHSYDRLCSEFIAEVVAGAFAGHTEVTGLLQALEPSLPCSHGSYESDLRPVLPRLR